MGLLPGAGGMCRGLGARRRTGLLGAYRRTLAASPPSAGSLGKRQPSLIGGSWPNPRNDLHKATGSYKAQPGLKALVEA